MAGILQCKDRKLQGRGGSGKEGACCPGLQSCILLQEPAGGIAFISIHQFYMQPYGMAVLHDDADKSSVVGDLSDLVNAEMFFE
jgi:hypothetical protein